MANQDLNLIDAMGRDGALLSAIEVGLGSVLHSFHVPFSGQFLSLNQGFILSRATLKVRNYREARFVGAHVSNVAAVLKSLSPSGKKLTPMLAISAQGFLFSVGTFFLGVNPVGIFVGMVLLCLWAFLQPLLIYFLLYGDTLLQVAQYYFDKFSEVFTFNMENLIWVLGGLILVKIALAFVVVCIAFWLPETWVKKYEQKLLLAGRVRRLNWKETPVENSVSEAFFLAIKDLFNPLFLISLLVTGFFFYFAHSPFSTLIWSLLRPIGIGFILFFSIRLCSFEKLFQKMEGGRLRGITKSLRIAVKAMKEI